jgi:hypothetical protein
VARFHQEAFRSAPGYDAHSLKVCPKRASGFCYAAAPTSMTRIKTILLPEGSQELLRALRLAIWEK